MAYSRYHHCRARAQQQRRSEEWYDSARKLQQREGAGELR